MNPDHPNALRLFLCGDVMTGRGIDQVLPHPGSPVLYEPFIHDAREYVALAENANGPLRRPVTLDYIWGEALPELANVDLRIINLETSITSDGAPWPDKGIHYRMHPQNVGCLSAAGIDGCALANNHILDWGTAGLAETLRVLDQAGVAHAGAGRDQVNAEAPAVLNGAGKGRVLLFSFGSTTSGIPPEWSATPAQPGVTLLEDLSVATAAQISKQMLQFQQPGDLLVASIHWGANWGYDIPAQQIAFAHRLIEEGIAVVHGHSSHHVKAIEVFKERLILYGCGDFLTDYEGIGGYEGFRDDLVLMYLVELEQGSGRLVSARLVPFQLRRFRLESASETDAEWLRALLNRQGAPFGTRVQPVHPKGMILQWRSI